MRRFECSAILFDLDGVLMDAAASRLLRALPPGSWGIVGAEDASLGHPGLDPYLAAAGTLGVPPACCLAIEDAPAGIEGARAAGMTVVGLTTTHSSDLLPADACVASLGAVHIGRMDRDPQGRWQLEVLVVEE